MAAKHCCQIFQNVPISCSHSHTESRRLAVTWRGPSYFYPAVESVDSAKPPTQCLSLIHEKRDATGRLQRITSMYNQLIRSEDRLGLMQDDTSFMYALFFVCLRKRGTLAQRITATPPHSKYAYHPVPETRYLNALPRSACYIPPAPPPPPHVPIPCVSCLDTLLLRPNLAFPTFEGTCLIPM